MVKLYDILALTANHGESCGPPYCRMCRNNHKGLLNQEDQETLSQHTNKSTNVSYNFFPFDFFCLFFLFFCFSCCYEFYCFVCHDCNCVLFAFSPFLTCCCIQFCLFLFLHAHNFVTIGDRLFCVISNVFMSCLFLISCAHCQIQNTTQKVKGFSIVLRM
eukprot:384139_1